MRQHRPLPSQVVLPLLAKLLLAKLRSHWHPTRLLVALTLFSPAVYADSSPPRVGLTLHLDASVGVQANNQRVTNWWDQSGYGQNLVAAGSPRIVNRGPNNQPVIELDQLTDKLVQLRDSNLPQLDNDRTLVLLSAASNTHATLGYGGATCGANFALSKDADGYSALTTGCDGSTMHAQGHSSGGAWNLHILILRAGTFLHLRDGELVDGRTGRFQTRQGPFEIETLPLDSGANPVSSLRVATVMAYNWALSANDINHLQRYIGRKWFNNPGHFKSTPNLAQVELPKPVMQLSHHTTTNRQLELSWRVSFADECRADTGWTPGSSTSGHATITNPPIGASYGLNCWNRTASATANFTANPELEASAKPVRVHWQKPADHREQATGYKLFVGTQSGNYSQIVQLPADAKNDHTLQLSPGSYFLAISTLGALGQQSPLSGELAFRVD